MNPNLQNKAILILGGYGTFGRRIAKQLCAKGCQVIINGRRLDPAIKLKNAIKANQPTARIAVSCFDVHQQLEQQLAVLKPALVIHTCGPFQGQNTQVAECIIRAGCDYLDLADGRDYVRDILNLDEMAKANGVTAITGASTVPVLSSAVLLELQKQHKIDHFNEVKIGISPGQRTERGLATTEAVLSYIGKALPAWPGTKKTQYGWQSTYLQTYPNLSARMMGNCEAPDLDCLPQHFSIDALQFSAGMESKVLHALIWVGAWLVRLGLPLKLNQHASKLLAASRWFDPLGTVNGGMHVSVKGKDTAGQWVDKTWFLEAWNNHGPDIPATPAIILAPKLIAGTMAKGACACVNLIQLEEYLAALDNTQIKTYIK